MGVDFDADAGEHQRRMLDTHPDGKGFIFQIDGNFGATAAIAELLLQSHDGSIDLCLLADGVAIGKGNRPARSRGVSIDIQWKGGKATACSLRADRSGEHLFRAPPGQTISSIRSGAATLPRKENAAGATMVVLPALRSCQITFT